MPPRDIGKSTQQTFLWIALIPVVLAAVGWWSARDYNNRLEWVRHTREVLNGIDRAVLTVTDAETSQRGYLLTGDSSYLGGYRAALASLDPQLAQLRALVGDNPAEVTAAARLSFVAHSKMDELRRTVELAGSGRRA